jgi:hypothetical protein
VRKDAGDGEEYSMDPEVIFHPVRMRLITAVSGRRVTAKQLLKEIPDIPQATLYRHIRALIEGGIFEIAEERKIRGVEERLLRMRRTPSLSTEDLRRSTRADVERMAVVFTSGLLADFRRYLRGRRKPDPVGDGVQASKIMLYLDDEELEELNRSVLELIESASKKTAGVNRQGRIFSYTIIPAK